MTALKLYQTKHYSFMVSALFFFYFEMCWLNTEDAGATSLTISIPRALSLDIAPGTEPTFKKSALATFSVRSDAPYGYELNIKAKDAAQGNRLVNGAASLTSIPSALSEAQYQAPGHNNTWAYLPNKLNSSPNTNFQPGPTGTNTLLDRTTSANPATNSYSITLATKLDASIPSGTYQNTFILTASANAVTYRINYNLNSGTGGPSPNPQTGSTFATSVNLSPNQPTRANYIFRGWCSVSTTNHECSGTTYQPSSRYNLRAGSNTLNLWAMWQAQRTFQNVSDWKSDLNTGQTTTAIDTRDNKSYTVARFADNQVWMTQNLALGRSGATTLLTPADSDVSANYTLPASSPNGFSSLNVANIYVYNTTYGGYYTWTAATAGEGTNQSSSNVYILHSICPRGWRLPAKSDYETLISYYGGNTTNGRNALLASPVNFKKAGVYSNSKLENAGKSSYYWTTSNQSTANAWSFRLSDAYVGLDPFDYDKSGGMSVRCIARMQGSASASPPSPPSLELVGQ